MALEAGINLLPAHVLAMTSSKFTAVATIRVEAVATADAGRFMTVVEMLAPKPLAPVRPLRKKSSRDSS